MKNEDEIKVCETCSYVIKSEFGLFCEKCKLGNGHVSCWFIEKCINKSNQKQS